MFAELFNSTAPINAPASFGVGVLPVAPATVLRAPRFDSIGNRIPNGQNDADYAWLAAELQARMDQQSREEEATQQAEWDDTLREMAAEQAAIEEAERRYGRAAYGRAYC